MKQLTVKVTPKNIDEGRKMTCCSCPMALAINTEKNIYPEFESASIHPTEGWFTWRPRQGVRGTIYRFDLPPEAQAFVAAFERGEPLSPIEFDVKTREHGKASISPCTLPCLE